MSSGTISLISNLEPAPVYTNHRQRRPCFNFGLELVGQELLHLVIPLSLEMLAKLGCDAADMPTADGHFSQICQGLSGLIERRLPGTRADDLFENRGAIAL